MAINKVIYGTDTLVDLTEDTVTAEDVLNSKSFHTPDGVQRTGTASYPVTDVQVNGTSVMDGTVAKVEQPTADKKTATSEFNTADGGLLSKCQINLVLVQSGSGDPSPDNIRPISGHTEVDLYNVGKNLFDEIYTDIGEAILYKELIVTNGTYTMSSNCPLNSQNSCNLFFLTTGESPSMNTNGVWNLQSRTINVTDGKIRIAYRNRYSINPEDYNTQIEKGSDATTYESYNPSSHLYQVQIGSTVYGGYVDLVSGVMVATHGFITLNGTENITKSATTSCDIYIYTITPANFSQPFITSAFKYSSTAISAVGYAWRGTSDTQIRIGYAEYGTTTVNDFKTWLSNNPLQICYELATPTTIQLTPQQIETLAGQNNLSTPLDGQSIETNGVEYKELFTFADVKEYVDKKIPDAPTTDGTYTLQAVVSGGVPTYSWV